MASNEAGGAVEVQRDSVEIRLTIGGGAGGSSSSSNSGGGLCGDLGCGGAQSAGRRGRGRGQAEREAEGRARHEAEVVQAVERLVLQHGIGGATTVPAAFAIRPRSLSSSSFSSSAATADTSVGLVREKRVTLVSAALDPASLEDNIRKESEDDDSNEGDEAVEEEEDAEEEVLYDACKAAPPGAEEAVGETLGEVCITVPSTMDKDLLLSQHEHERYVMNVVQRLILIAGRVTAVPATGFWMLESATANSAATGDRLMQERVTIVSAACVVDAKVRSVVKETATWLANALGQEAVFVKINNQPYLIRMTDDLRKENAPKKPKKPRGRRSNKHYRFFKVAPTMVYECNYQS
jgi:hypothetical protein